jgi:nitric oxide reductase large subunit
MAQDPRQVTHHRLDLLVGELQTSELGHVQHLLAIDHGADIRRQGAEKRLAAQPVIVRAMQGPTAERFVVLNLRLLAVTFAVVGILFVAVPSGVLDAVSDVGEWLGNETRAPHTQEYLWLALAFAYMVVIAAICLVAQADVVRYRALLLVLAAGKTASSLGSLAFFLIQDQVFIYLLNFLVDGFLALFSLWLWAIAGRIGRPVEPG